MDLREVQSRGELLQTNRHPWEISRVEIAKDILEKHKSQLEGKVILDIGCGDTFVVEQLSNFLPDSLFFAVDIAFTKEMIAVYENKLSNTNIKLFTTLDESIDSLGKNEIGLVLLMDVIEHIEDDVLFLSDLSSRKEITQDTLMLITVPAFQSLFTSHDRFLGHFRRYTNNTLMTNLAKSGFSTIEIGYFYFSLIPIRILQFLKEKISSPSTNSTGLVEWKGGKLKSSLLTNMLLIDYRISKILKRIGIKLIGLSNYTVCKKSV